MNSLSNLCSFSLIHIGIALPYSDRPFKEDEEEKEEEEEEEEEDAARVIV